jgi:hypothetical protein
MEAPNSTAHQLHESLPVKMKLETSIPEFMRHSNLGIIAMK